MTPEDVLSFWFPPGYDRDEPSCRKQITCWFRGGTDEEIIRRFAAVTDDAAAGGLRDWDTTPRGRLAHLLVLDQFSRSLYRDTPRAFAQDARASKLAVAALDAGDADQLAVWEATFLAVALGHSEDLALQDRAVAVVASLVERAPPYLRALVVHALGQAKAHREVIQRFGRHPHRNKILGRENTADEEAYLAKETPPHQRPAP
jgi:uncharacterized protein (DUF924 family)